ncbi:hypothetical protein OE88DRAFT_627747 [Heliocybe sulcata]|uniref:Glucose-methanol-choline oxidoreductase N-terminal domain-containing protein n=1 Tax=Heliocybe sulcata TaxID=5364 RepID=A0A5C3NPB6_9AGAM|nr:hypothetical protein OE88DRAFT_627747 [Heliocybe sulcata]
MGPYTKHTGLSDDWKITFTAHRLHQSIVSILVKDGHGSHSTCPGPRLLVILSTHSRYIKHVFDYVVVGGGTCGLAVASLLSNNATATVAVIEAGGYVADDTVLVPGMIGQALGNYDWNFSSTPQHFAADRRIPMFRGKLLGGTSAINYMAFTRGSKIEHNGWDWDTISSAIKASENWTPPPTGIASLYHAPNDHENHGSEGYIKTSSHNYYYDLAVRAT